MQLDRFQEWPQLLDPVLAGMVQAVVEGFLSYVTAYAESYAYQTDQSQTQAVPLPLALSRLLYTFCKVRGYKVIVRLLSNEPRYVEPMLSAYRRWEALRTKGLPIATVWEEKYIMLLWLSHLMLAPFELSTMSTTNELSLDLALQSLCSGLPEVAVDVLTLGFQNLSSASKERESAVLLLVRLALRRDMQGVGLAGRLVDHALHMLLEAPTDPTVSAYQAIGHLSLLYALVNLGTDSEVAPFVKRVFGAVSTLATSPLTHHAAIRSSAPARKLLIKVTRVCLTHGIALTDNTPDMDSDSVNEMLEEGIQNYLDALGDKDSPVRLAASKALSIVALKLNNDMAAEIIEAVLASLSENILVQDPTTNRLMAKTEQPLDSTALMRRNVSAVDPLRWHGLMLTLGHLLFRRSPPPHLLADIVEALILGLEFEQRSNVGTSVGNGVRDAACFGIWALSRKYSTAELEPIKIGHVAGMSQASVDGSHSVLQLLAVRLVLSACFDPSGNIRRGSSAALQELIGRHPDTIVQGIPVVQVVDYQAVARRSRAMTVVAVDAAALDQIYHDALLEALLDWRGARAADADSRRWASTAMLKLNQATTVVVKETLLKTMIGDVQALKPRNLGATAGARHGLLLCMAAVIRSMSNVQAAENKKISAMLTALHLSGVTGSLEGRTTNDMELVIEAIGIFFEACIKTLLYEEVPGHTAVESTTQEMLGIINHCITVCSKRAAVSACATAVSSLFEKLDSQNRAQLLTAWLSDPSQKRSDVVCKGRLAAVSQIHALTVGNAEQEHMIVTFFADIVSGATDGIETRTTAMDSLASLIQRCGTANYPSLDLAILQPAFLAGLNDYTNDQRGDIGSLLRLATLDAIEVLCDHVASYGQHNSSQPSTDASQLIAQLIPSTVRLAAEKLNKVRHRAWKILNACWCLLHREPPLTPSSSIDQFEHLADVSTQAYFFALIKPLLRCDDDLVRRELVRGLASSAAGTTEEIGRACCAALVRYRLGFGAGEARERAGREAVWAVLANLEGPDGVTKVVANSTAMDDHMVIPMLELLSFLLGQDFLSASAARTENAEVLWTTTQKVHMATASMERTDALIKLYQSLLAFPVLRSRALDKLTRFLLHRYPKVRNAAADVLFLEDASDKLAKRDWNAAAATNKPVVLELRRDLGVAKMGAQRAAA